MRIPVVLLLATLCAYAFAYYPKQQNNDLFQHEDSTEVEKYYAKNCCNSEPSISQGTVSNGSLKHGKLMPFSGPNFHYFDTLSYLSGRAYVNHLVKQTIVATYASFEKTDSDLKFGLMECAHEHGGKLFPHRTHQNGLSVDFMSPKLKDGKPYYDLNHLGADHYWLDFDNNGNYTEDPNISLDFNLIARHIVKLDEIARQYGLKINKVIFKMELKDELYATEYGKTILKKGIYITKKLDPLVNALHDDHYHIDFEIL